MRPRPLWRQRVPDGERAMQNREYGGTEAIRRLAEIVRPILDRHGVTQAAVFGLKDELERALGRTVDLAHPRTLKPRVRDAILASRVPLP